MSGKKMAQIGGTINLGNYENHRYEFSGEVSTSDDYMKLLAFAGSCLLGQAARAAPDVREKIRSHVAQVIGVRVEDLPQVVAAEQPAPEPKPSAQQPAAAAPASPSPEKEPQKPAAAEQQKIVCSECGTEIPKEQSELSQLFFSKNLCKNCFDAMQQGAVG